MSQDLTQIPQIIFTIMTVIQDSIQKFNQVCWSIIMHCNIPWL